jgi:hypothetical protein
MDNVGFMDWEGGDIDESRQAGDDTLEVEDALAAISYSVDEHAEVQENTEGTFLRI